ncbi:MAG: hypothetical protein GWN00_16005 [Aliifodinibius sp.]|nr:glycosyltransferase family 39 protein [Fodinibius sp.]NIV12551.1 hypothetical protein [Fodinibius sp.]NIY26253.1 hypothetical protein [Fodinibius sp.]
MTTKLTTQYKEHKKDIINLVILISITSLLGFYLIATTIMIAKDGVFYIERAQKLSTDPISIIKTNSPGYEFLILAAHKVISLFSDRPSVGSWIYSAQSVNLLCRVLALVPLYFIGKLFVGSRNSFLALLILVLLPYPAKFGSDTLRDWPHILFLATGFLFLLLGAKKGTWGSFGIVGLAAGIGHIIRPECAQLVIYAVLWLLIRLFQPKRNMNKFKIACALIVLLIGFAIPTAPYIKVRGAILPKKLKALTNYRLQSGRIHEPDIDCYDNVYTAAGVPSEVAKAIGVLIREISGDLFHFFLPVLLLGFYSRFRKTSAAKVVERFFVPVFIFFNIIMMILLYCGWHYISRRHSLPLVVFTIFYVPIGLQILADWLNRKFPIGRLDNNPKSRLWFFILIITGLAICTPKLLRPIRIEKKAHKAVAQWLKENTHEDNLIAVFDKRILLYSERKGLVNEENIPNGVEYAVKVMKGKDENLDVNKTVREEFSLWIDQQKKTKKIVIYKVL